MPEEYKAIHLHAGRSAGAELVEAWLSRHRVRKTAFEDPYQACVYLIRHADQVADFAFVDADSLSREELAIVQYLRETWPAVGMIIYSGRDQAELPESGPLQRTCRDEASLHELLELAPDRLLRRLRIFPDQQRNGGTRRNNRKTARDRAETHPGQPPKSSDGQLRSPQPPSGVAEKLGRGILSPEELSALLEENGNQK